ncbi:MAG: hypothetical protein AB8B58_04360 [Roseobacter sp.]
MGERPDPLFLERKSYRRRRLFDAIKLVVFLAFMLFMIPLLWPSGAGEASAGMPMSTALSFVFGAWLAVIVIAAGLTVGRNRSQDEQATDSPEIDP